MAPSAQQRDDDRTALLSRVAAATREASRTPRPRHGMRVAIAATLIAAVLAFALRDALGTNVASLFLAAVVVSAWFGERAGGLLATVALGAAFVVFLLTTPGVPGAGHVDVLRLVMYVLAALLITWGCTSLRVAQRRAQDHADELALLSQQLADQSVELEEQIEQAQTLASELEQANREMEELTQRTDHVRSGAMAAVREREHALALLDALLASAPMGFALHNRDLRYLRINRVLAEINGVPIADHIGHTMRDVVPTIAPIVEPVLERVLATGEPIVDMELTGSTAASSEQRYWLASYFPVRSAANETIGVGAMVLDVSEHTRLKAQFHQAQKMEAVGRLAGGVAHDFNNLLTAIMCYCVMAADKLGGGESCRSELEEIANAASRAAGLTGQLLAFSRKQVMHPVVLDVNLRIQQLHRMLSRLIGAEIELQLIPGNVGRVFIDPVQLDQVILNLAVNACDAMPDGGRLTIQTANGELTADTAHGRTGGEPGSYVLIAVRDTGIGMDEATKSRLFEPFFTTKEPGRGTGLGLSTAYGIVRQSGGDVGVQSEPGKGTTFTVYLPRVEGEASEPPAPPTALPPRRTGTVLVAEDDDIVRVLARRILERAGYHVVDAARGDEALERARAVAPGLLLLLTDVVLPGMAGRELAEHVLALHPHCRVLFMSGYTDDDVLRRGDLPANTRFVQKPFTPSALLSSIAHALEDASAPGGH
ncbi:MAG TPA: ATP-binding protein [Gemmatimonadaceae bacterium]|nr:ATP-binding protein [Gemmatimonadaceae bacterium]